MQEDKTAYIGFRVTPQERAWLETLAEQTERNLSGLMRVLVREAQLSGHSDLDVTVTAHGGREVTK